jgi:hypothetical protein
VVDGVGRGGYWLEAGLPELGCTDLRCADAQRARWKVAMLGDRGPDALLKVAGDGVRQLRPRPTQFRGNHQAGDIPP